MGNQNSRVLLEAASSGSLAQLKSVLGSTDVNVTDEVGILVLVAPLVSTQRQVAKYREFLGC